MTVEMKPVQSSNIAAIGHDPATNELHVRFADGATYVYAECPAAAHAALCGAESVGKHFHSHIKGKYPHRKNGA